MKKQKWLKIAKISLITLLCITCLALPIFAVYTSGDYNTPRYYSPMHFDFEIFGTTAQLTPTISYKSGQTLTYDTTETATQGVGEGSVINSISRTNFSVSTLTDQCLDVSYRLQFNLNESTDNFSMRITNNGGIYDFIKYGIPQLSVPTGYTANVTTMYSLRFTQEQPSKVNVANVTIDGTFLGGGTIPLLKDSYTLNGVSYGVVGGVFVEDYIAEITFTKDQSEELVFGDAGYYLFNSVLEEPSFANLYELSDFDSDYLTIMDYYGGSFFKFNLHFVIDGVAYSTIVNQFLFYGSEDTTYDFNYGSTDWDTDFGALAYSFEYGEWTDLIVRAIDVGVDPDLADEDGYIYIPIDYIRLLEFTGTTNFAENESRLKLDLGNYGVLTGTLKTVIYDEIMSWLEESTILYPENPLTMVETVEGSNTYAFTDGDGGMYFHYYVDPNLNLEYRQTVKDLYDYGVTVGYGNGGNHTSQFTSHWIGNAVKGVMEIEIFPNFTFGAVLGAIVSLGITVALLKFFSGG